MSESNWSKISSEISKGCSKKELWGLLRQFQLPDPDSFHPTGWLWQLASEQISQDEKAHKLKLHSGLHQDACETVLLRPRRTRFAVCLSTQVGCAVGCRFCATGKMGLQRNLTAWEIVEQFLWAGWAARKCAQDGKLPIPLRNVVFMGMGEPLHNPIAVEQAIELLSDPRWFGLSLRSITLSSVGVPGKMVQMARRFPRLRIALSLHSADPLKRRWLVPKAVSDLQSLRQAIQEIHSIQGDTVWLEIALIAGVNDSMKDARDLIEFCRGLSVEVNVIPYNDTSPTLDGTTFRAPSPDVTNAFIARIRREGIFVTHRKTLGQSIQAACGQLVTSPESVDQ